MTLRCAYSQQNCGHGREIRVCNSPDLISCRDSFPSAKAALVRAVDIARLWLQERAKTHDILAVLCF